MAAPLKARGFVLLGLAVLGGVGCPSRTPTADGPRTGASSALSSTSLRESASASASPFATSGGAASASASCEGIACVGESGRAPCAPGVPDAAGGCVCPAGYRSSGPAGKARCEVTTSATTTARPPPSTTATATAPASTSTWIKSGGGERCPPGSELCN